MAISATLALTVAAAVGCEPRDLPRHPTPAHPQAVRAPMLPRGPLRSEGRWIKDATGRTVIVHGLQIARKTNPYLPPAESFTARDAAAIERWGFNAVRLAWFWKGLEPERGTIDRSYAENLARIGRLLADRNVFTLLEAHQDGYNERLGGAGFPDWATIGESPPNPNGLLGEQSWQAFENLYADTDGIAGRFEEAWKVMAEAFRANPRMLGYDLFNEPGAGRASASCLSATIGCAAFDGEVLGPFQDRLARAVRSVDRRGIVFYEPNIFHDVGGRSRLGPPSGNAGSAGFAFHAYCLNRFLNPLVDHESEAPGYEACGALDARTFDNAAATAAEMGVPAIYGEFGDTQDTVDIARMIDLADSHLMGWIYWGYKDWDDDPGGPGSGPLFDDSDHDGTLRAEKLAVLSRPYAMATAGTPLSSQYDRATRTFTYEFAPDRSIAAPTVVFTSPLNSPGGYRVTVEGAVVTSPPGAAHLELRPLPGATHVKLRLVGLGRPAADAGSPGSIAIAPRSTSTGPAVVEAPVSPVGASPRTCTRNVGDPPAVTLGPVGGAGSGGRLVARLTSGGARGSVATDRAVSVTFGPSDVTWVDVPPATDGRVPALALLCRVGGSYDIYVGAEPVVPTAFSGRSTHNVNVATASSRLGFRVSRRGRHVAEVDVRGGSILVGLRRPDGSMPTATRLDGPGTVDLGLLGAGHASIDVVALPGMSATWSVTIRRTRG